MQGDLWNADSFANHTGLLHLAGSLSMLNLELAAQVKIPTVIKS